MKNFKTRLFDFTTEKVPVGIGSLMISEPMMREEYFVHAVVSIVDYEPEGSCMGVVLNNCTALNLGDIVDEVSDCEPVPVYCGGPMSHDRLFFLHTLGDGVIPGAAEYAPGLWVGGEYDAILQYIRDGYPTKGFVRFFLGYSGWTAGQLAAELKNDAWAVVRPERMPAATTLLSSSGDRLWHTVVRAMGPHYRMWGLQPVSVTVN